VKRLAGLLTALGLATAGAGAAKEPQPSSVLPDETLGLLTQNARLHDELAVSHARERRAWSIARRRLRVIYRLRRRWAPTVDYALRLGSAVSGVSYYAMRSVAWCESRLDPGATNGRYKGIFQLGWSPLGFSAYDPVANAISTGMTVAHDGSWRQWECKP